MDYTALSAHNRVHALGAAFVSAVTAIVLVVLAVVVAGHALWSLAAQIRTPSGIDAAVIPVVEDGLLLLIVGELLVTITQKADLVHELLLFLLIGVTALVRHGIGVVLAREVNTHTATDLVLNSIAILVLAGAFVLVRRLAVPRGGTEHAHRPAAAGGSAEPSQPIAHDFTDGRHAATTWSSRSDLPARTP